MDNQTSTLDFKVPGQFQYRGITYGRLQNGLNINLTDKWKVDPRDVLIAAYPKTGTTWLGAIIPLITLNGDLEAFKAKGPLMHMVPYLEITPPGRTPTLDEMDQMKHPRIIKTHLSYEFLQKPVEQDNLKVVVILRNPKDTLVSYYYMYKLPNLSNFPGSFHDFFKFHQEKRVFYGDIFEWYCSWWEKRNLPNILMVKYEDLHKDSAKEVKRIAEFMGVDLENATIKRIADETSFDNLRKIPAFGAPEKAGIKKPDQDKFFRKGRVGDWKNYFTDDESKIFDEMSAKYFDPIGLSFDYE